MLYGMGFLCSEDDQMGVIVSQLPTFVQVLRTDTVFVVTRRVGCDNWGGSGMLAVWLLGSVSGEGNAVGDDAADLVLEGERIAVLKIDRPSDPARSEAVRLEPPPNASSVRYLGGVR